MKTHQQLLDQLTALQPLEEPPGDAGVIHRTPEGSVRSYAPVISVYLDMSVEAEGARPDQRTGAVVLRERLREIARTFWPRGLAYDAVVADTGRIETYLAERAARDARGIAIFASAQHGLFEVLEAPEPFEHEVSVRAEPSLFQLTRLLDNQETAVVAVVAVVALNVARLFVVRAGRLIAVEQRADDPKLFHKVRGTNAMNQKRYQRHAQLTREHFAHEVASLVEQLVQRERAVRVVVAGELEAVALLRKALPPSVSALVSEPSPRLDARTSTSAVAAAIEPVLFEAQQEEHQAAVEQLLEGIQAGELGISGLDMTRAALQAGQVDLLVLSSTAVFPAETRSALIELAEQTGTRVEVVDGNAALDELGGVGAILRYRIPSLDPSGVFVAPQQ